MKVKGMAAACLAGMMIFLGGCESTELEQRGFPLAMGVDVQEEEGKLTVSFDFPDLAQISDKSETEDTPVGFSLEGGDLYHVEKAYENNTNKNLDYNHLKAVVLGESILKQEGQLRGFLQAMEQQASARNASLFLGSPKAAAVLALTGETEGSVGKYLEEMAESQKDFKQDKIVTAGSLMNQWHNQNELLLVPVLTENGGRPVISGYGVISTFQYLGQITVEQAMQSFLCQNLLERFTWESGQGTVLELTDLRAEREITGTSGSPQIKTRITGNGRIKTGGPSGEGTKLRLEQQVNEQLSYTLTETAGELRQAMGIDLTNSYISLGGYHRALYNAYESRPQAYARQLNHVFEVEITLLNWE